MADFKIDGRMTVRQLKENFKKEFEGTLRVYDGREKADDNATLAAIRQNDDVKKGEYACRASRTVGKFEQEMLEVFGIKVQVASPDDWVLALDGITLANLKNIKKNATKADMEELVAYKRKKKENEFDHANDTANETIIKTFKVRIKVSEACHIKLANIDTEKYNIDEISHDDVYDDMMGGGNFVCQAGLGDGWNDNFELKVYDEDDELVYESESYDHFKFITNFQDFETEDFETIAELKSVKKICEDLWKKEHTELSEGYYGVGCYVEDSTVFTFTIEDSEFDPSKLLFIRNSKVDGVWYNHMTDKDHIVYNDKLVNAEYDLDEDGASLCTDMCILHRANALWSKQRELGLRSYGLNLCHVKNIPEKIRKADLEQGYTFPKENTETDVTTSSKIFKVVLKDSWPSAIELLKISEDWDKDEISMKDATEVLNGKHFFSVTMLDIEKGDNNFELNVYDENDELVYESEDFSDFRFVYEFNDWDIEEWDSNSDFSTVKRICEDLWKKEEEELSEGYYLSGYYEYESEAKYSFIIEDSEFDPSKLIFISNKKVEGIRNEYASDPYHLLYDNKIITPQHENDESKEISWQEYAVKYRDEDGSWEDYRDIDDDE